MAMTATIATSGSYVYVAWVSQTKVVNFSTSAPRTLYIRVNSNHGKGAWRTAIRLSSLTGRVYDAHVAAAGAYVYVSVTDSNTGAHPALHQRQPRSDVAVHHARGRPRRSRPSASRAARPWRRTARPSSSRGRPTCRPHRSRRAGQRTAAAPGRRRRRWRTAPWACPRSPFSVAGQWSAGRPTMASISGCGTSAGWGPLRHVSAPDTGKPYSVSRSRRPGPQRDVADRRRLERVLVLLRHGRLQDRRALVGDSRQRRVLVRQPRWSLRRHRPPPTTPTTRRPSSGPRPAVARSSGMAYTPNASSYRLYTRTSSAPRDRARPGVARLQVDRPARTPGRSGTPTYNDRAAASHRRDAPTDGVAP